MLSKPVQVSVRRIPDVEEILEKSFVGFGSSIRTFFVVDDIRQALVESLPQHPVVDSRDLVHFHAQNTQITIVGCAESGMSRNHVNYVCQGAKNGLM